MYTIRHNDLYGDNQIKNGKIEKHLNESFIDLRNKRLC